MKRFASLIIAFVLLLSVCAVAESSESVVIGNYIITTTAFTCSANSETDIDIFFNDANIAGNLQYMSYESLDVSYSDFAILGLDDNYSIADMFVNAIANQGMMDSVEKENFDFSEGVSGIIYYGVFTEEYDSVNYCGVLLVDDTAIFSCLCLGLYTSETAESLRAAVDTFLADLSVEGAAAAVPAADSEDSDSALGSVGNMLSGFTLDSDDETTEVEDAYSDETADTEVEDTYTDDSVVGDIDISDVEIYMGESVEIGAHTVYIPIDWELSSSSENQLIFTCGDVMITVGVYEFDDPSILEAALNMESGPLVELLKESTIEGLNSIGFDASDFSFSTTRYSLSNSYMSHFEGDASSQIPGYYLCGTTMLTDIDMAMIMVFAPTDASEDIDLYLWDAIAMFFN